MNPATKAWRGVSRSFFLAVLCCAPGCSKSTTLPEIESDGGAGASAGTDGGESGGSGAHGGSGGAGGSGEGVSCEVDGKVFPSGSSGISAADGCNTCSCQDGTLACTEMACVPSRGSIALYRVEREGWRDDALPVDELVRSVVGEPGLTTDDIISYDWDARRMRVSVDVLDRWQSSGLLDASLIAQEPVLFLLYVDGEALFPVALWPITFASLPPYRYFYAMTRQGYVEIQFFSSGTYADERKDGRLYRALWEARLLLNPASGEGTCSVDGVRYPDGMEKIQDPTSCNNCFCANGGALGCTTMYCPVEQTEYGEIVNGSCESQVSIDNPQFRNGIIYLDCGAAVDGPAYYFDESSGALISTCGGACMVPDPARQQVCRTLCPPPGW